MQTPTPPTKPTPPTPPSMKTTNAVPTTDTHTPAKAVPQTTTTGKETPKVSADPSQPALTTDSKNNIPPLGSYSNSGKETSSETKLPPIVPNQKNSPTSTNAGMTIFLVLTLFIALGITAIHWFKNNKPKQKSTINYASESTDDIVDLILSKKTAEPAPVVTAKSTPKKTLLKPAAKPKNKGGFEVRV